MKKLMLMLVAILAMTACKKEDQGVTPQNIVGKWNVTEQWDNDKWTDIKSQGLSAEFKADNNYSASMIGRGTYTIAGNTVVCTSESKTTYNLVFEIDGNNATITIKKSDEILYKVKATRE